MKSCCFSVACYFLCSSSSSLVSAHRHSPSAEKGIQRRWEHRKTDFDDSKHDEEFWSFVTRPDLDAPRWNVTIHDESLVTPGYWFVGPYEEVEQEEGSAAWNAPHIYDNHGELIWSGAPMFHGFSTFDFRVSEVQGKPMLSLIRPNINYAVVLDEGYNIYENVDIGHTDPAEEELGLNIHEFQTVDNGKKVLYLTCVPKKTSTKLSAAIEYDGECQAVYDGFIVKDTETWEPIFEWNSYGKIGLDESYVTQEPVEERCSYPPWDFVHLNSIDQFPDGDYLLSGRRTNTLYKVSGEDGSIVWRLGGRQSDFTLPIVFSGQHAARVVSQNDTHSLVSFLDNAWGPGDPKTTNDASRGLLLALDTKAMTVEVVQEFKHPHHGYAQGQGNLQWLEPSGHAWICWQDRALHSEHTTDGKLVMEAEFKAGVRNYRSFKQQWVGKPSQPPDVRSAAVREIDGSYSTIVSMSWNGATEVRSWNVYEANPFGQQRTLIATPERTGFETTIWVDGYISHVIVEALDILGESLGEAIIFATVPTLEELNEAQPESVEQSWLQSVTKRSFAAFIFGAIFSIATVLGVYGVFALRSRGEVPWMKRNRVSYESVDTNAFELAEDEDDDKETSSEGLLDKDQSHG